MVLCTFQDNVCDWENKSDGPYKWERLNANKLIEDGNPGPAGDLNNDATKNFMIASDARGGDSKPGDKAWLKSPKFHIEQHPLECLSFWFQFGVSTGKMQNFFILST